MVNIDAYDFNAAGIAAMTLVAAMIEKLSPAERAELIATAEAKVGPLPTDQPRADLDIRNRTIALIRGLR